MANEVYISFKKLEKLLNSKGKKWQYLRDEKISPGIVAKMKDGTGHIDTRTIQKVCELLNCQPGQIMEYIPASKIESKTPEQNIKQLEREEDYHKRIQQAQSLEDLQAIINANKAENKAEKNQDKAEEEPF